MPGGVKTAEAGPVGAACPPGDTGGACASRSRSSACCGEFLAVRTQKPYRNATHEGADQLVVRFCVHVDIDPKDTCHSRRSHCCPGGPGRGWAFSPGASARPPGTRVPMANALALASCFSSEDRSAASASERLIRLNATTDAPTKLHVLAYARAAHRTQPVWWQCPAVIPPRPAPRGQQGRGSADRQLGRPWAGDGYVHRCA